MRDSTSAVDGPDLERGLEEAKAALALGEWAVALERYEKLAMNEPSSPEVMEGLGWAAYWLQDAERSLEARENAYTTYLKRGDLRPACRVALGLAIDSVDYRGIAVGSGWLSRAATLVDQCDTDGAERGWLLLWQGHFARAFDHDATRARANAAAAGEIARKLGLHDLELLATALDGLTLVTEGNIRDGMRQLDEATAGAMASEISDLDAVAATCCFLFYACERVRDYERAAQWDARIDSFSKRWHIRPMMTVCRTQYAAVLVGQGRWEEAETILVSAHAELERTRPILLAETILQLGELRRRQGRTEEALDLFGRFENRTESLLGRAAILVDSGDERKAIRLLERFLRRELAEKWIARAHALELIVRSQVRLGELELARGALDELRSMARSVDSPSIMAFADLAEGGLAIAHSEIEDGCRALERAVDRFDECGTPFEAVVARIELAGALAFAGRDTDARHLANEALELAGRMGAVGLEEAAARRLDTLPDRKTDARNRLTPRELEVLRLIARGRSNRTIATELGLSPHTIHRHVANILTKLDLPSRAAAVAAAARMELL